MNKRDSCWIDGIYVKECICICAEFVKGRKLVYY